MKARSLTILIPFLGATTVAAQPFSHWWLALGGGSGEVEVVGHDRSEQIADLLENLGWTVLEASGGEHDNTTVLNLRGGYRFNNYLGLELAYWDLGQTEGDFLAKVERKNAATTVEGSLESSYQTWALAMLASWPVHRRVSLNGKLGVHRWQHRFELRGNGANQSVEGSQTDSGYSWLWALGFELTATSWLGFDFYWQRFGGIEQQDGIDVKALGIIFRF